MGSFGIRIECGTYLHEKHRNNDLADIVLTKIGHDSEGCQPMHQLKIMK
jgi:hypothetical protein